MNPRLVFFSRLSRLATFSRGLVAGFVVLNGLVLALALVSLARNRDEHRSRAVVATQNLAQLLEINLQSSLQRADRELLTVREEVERETDEGRIDVRALNDFFARAFLHRIDFDSLQVTDASGTVLAAAGSAPLPQSSIAQQDFFVRLRDDPRARTIFAKTAPARGTQESGIILAQRIEQRHTGEFAGVVYAVLEPDRLHGAFSGLDLGTAGLVAIRDLDLGSLVRQPQLPDNDATAGQRAISSAFRQSLYANPDSGTFTSKNGWDGVERTNTYRKVAGYPYFVIVGLSTDDYLRGWRRESLTTLALTGCFALVTFVLSEQLRRLWTRREAAIAMLAKQEARFRMLLEWAPDALVITDSNGLIVMINQRTETMFGYARGELVGRSVEVLLPERFRSTHSDMVRRFAAQPETRKMGIGRSLWALAKDGREFPVNISLSPIETEEGLLINADIRDMRGLAK